MRSAQVARMLAMFAMVSLGLALACKLTDPVVWLVICVTGLVVALAGMLVTIRPRALGFVLATGFLGAVALVFFPFVARERGSRSDSSVSRLHQLWVAMSLYYEDEGGYPEMRTPASLRQALRPYIH